jgi:uncharacterized protein (TIGR00661 family)
LLNNQQTVLVSPLDWGLGHASRMIPVIEHFLSDGYHVILGGSGKSGELLQKTFPQLEFHVLHTPVIRYSEKGFWLVPSLLWQLPKMVYSVFHEHVQLKKLVTSCHIDMVVSDNRYGLFTDKAYTIFITHQVSPILPRILKWAEYPLYLLIRRLIHRFDTCWIPDYADPEKNLSGKLSHRFKLPRNAIFIGILSRFHKNTFQQIKHAHGRYDLVVVLSGPEPQLRIINETVLRQISSLAVRKLVITGMCDLEKSIEQDENLTLAAHLPPADFGQALLQAKIIVCRAGYSGIMDLVALRKPALLVPTPGQTEQQYLAEYLSEKNLFPYVAQKNIELHDLVKINALLNSHEGTDFPQTEKIPDLAFVKKKMQLIR